MDHGNGCPPVSLPGDSPIPEPKTDCPCSEVVFFKIGGYFFEGFAIVHTVELTGIDHAAFTRVGFGHGLSIQIRIFGCDDHNNVQAVFTGKIKIALIVGRN